MIEATCHCGAIRLEVARRPSTLCDCNCSICRRYGARWAYYTRRTVKITGETTKNRIYTRGARSLEFHFCGRCGCVVYHERAKKTGLATRIGVNTRMMPPESTARARVHAYDGASEV